MLLESYRYIVRMYLTCNASTMSAGCAHRLCYASSICMLHIWGAVIACVQFSSLPIVTTLPEGNVGHETALSTDLDPKNSMAFSCYNYTVIGIICKCYVCSLRICVYTLGEKKNTFLPMTNCPSNGFLDDLSSTYSWVYQRMLCLSSFTFLLN